MRNNMAKIYNVDSYYLLLYYKKECIIYFIPKIDF